MEHKKELGEGQGGHTKGKGVAPFTTNNRQVVGKGKDPHIGTPIIIAREVRNRWRNHHIGKALHLVACLKLHYKILSNTSQLLCSVGTFSVLVSRPVIENHEIGFTKGEIWYGEYWWSALHRIPCSWYMLGTTTRLSMLLQVLGLWLHLRETFFLGVGLTVTKKKSAETRLK